jgi:hypothetical protein
MSAKSDIVRKALLEVEKIESYVVENAKSQLIDSLAPQLKSNALNMLYEAVSVGKDQPSGYDQEADQDALAYGSSKHSTAKKDDINKGGKGPQKLESSIGIDETDEFDELDENEDELDVVSIDENEFEAEGGEGSDQFDIDLNELDEASDEDLDEKKDEDLDEKKDEDLDEKKDEDIDEAASKAINGLKKENRILRKTNDEYKRAFRIMESKFRTVNLLNAKLAGASKFLNIPGLTARQKEKIVEAFDNARSTREVGIIKDTLKESLRVMVRPAARPVNKVVSTASKTTLNEDFSGIAKEMQRLANIQ